MKKLTIILTALLLMALGAAAVGCSSGVDQEDYDAVVSERNAARADLTAANSALSAAEADLTAAEADVAAAEADLAAAEADADAAEADLDSAEADLASAEADLDGAEADLASAESDLASAESALEDCEASGGGGGTPCEGGAEKSATTLAIIDTMDELAVLLTSVPDASALPAFNAMKTAAEEADVAGLTEKWGAVMDTIPDIAGAFARILELADWMLVEVGKDSAAFPVEVQGLLAVAAALDAFVYAEADQAAFDTLDSAVAGAGISGLTAQWDPVMALAPDMAAARTQMLVLYAWVLDQAAAARDIAGPGGDVDCEEPGPGTGPAPGPSVSADNVAIISAMDELAVLLTATPDASALPAFNAMKTAAEAADIAGLTEKWAAVMDTIPDIEGAFARILELASWMLVEIAKDSAALTSIETLLGAAGDLDTFVYAEDGQAAFDALDSAVAGAGDAGLTAQWADVMALAPDNAAAKTQLLVLYGWALQQVVDAAP